MKLVSKFILFFITFILFAFVSLDSAYAAVTSIRTFGTSGSDNGEFISPLGIAVNSQNGAVYVTDTTNQNLQAFSENGTFLWVKDAFVNDNADPDTIDTPQGVAVNNTSGNVYITDDTGGGGGRVLVFDEDGLYVREWDGCGSGTCFNSPQGIAINQSTGNVFVTDYASSIVTEYEADGTYVSEVGSGGTGDGQYISPLAIAVDPINGDIYITDPTLSRMQRFNSEGVYQNRWIFSGAGITVNDNQNIYVSIYSSDLVRVYDSSGTQVDSWGTSGSGTGNIDDAPAITIGKDNHVYLAERGNYRVHEFYDSNAAASVSTLGPSAAVSGGYITTRQPELTFTLAAPVDAPSQDVAFRIQVSGSSNFIHSFIDYTSASASAGTKTFTLGQIEGSGTYASGSAGLKLSDGNYYWRVKAISGDAIPQLDYTPANSGSVAFIVDTAAPVVSKTISSNNTPEFVRTWGSSGSGDGQLSTTTPGVGTAVDSYGNIYIADRGNYRVQKFSPEGTFLMEWGSEGSDDGEFNGSFDIAIDSENFIYVLDNANYNVSKFTSHGGFILKFGSFGSGDGQLRFSNGLTVDSEDNIHITDIGNGRIDVFDSDGEFVRTWGSGGSGDGQFQSQYSIASDGNGHIYVGDVGLERIQKFENDGTYVTKWGSSGSGDGQFVNPSNIAVDSNRYVYVVDRNNHRVQVFDETGAFVTKWGSSGTDTGQFTNPMGIAVSSTGQVYVFDADNARVQQFGYEAVASATSSPSTDSTPTWTWDAYLDNISLASPPYTTQWSESSTFASGNSAGTAASISFTHASSLTNGTWYFRTLATDAAGNTSDYGPSGNTTINATVSFEDSPSQSSSPASDMPSTPTCATVPKDTPDLFQINTLANTATLYFTPVGEANRYVIFYGFNAAAIDFATTIHQGNSTGVIAYMINHLPANTTMYFRVQAANDCMNGMWSNTMAAVIGGGAYYENFAAHIVNPISQQAKILGSTAKTQDIKVPSNPKVVQVTPTLVPKPIPPKKTCFLFWCW